MINFKGKARWITLIFTSVLLITSFFPEPMDVEAAGTCAASSPPSGAYRITICFTAPGAGSVVSGDVGVAVSTDISGSSPGIQRIIFTMDGNELLIDYQTPYTFIIPTTKWQDGSYAISATALMRDGYTTRHAATISITFNNGITQPPVNHNTFTPSSGTTPSPGSPFVVVATGDGADGQTAATSVTNRIATINPNLFLYLGDVYEDGTIAEFYNWYGTGSTSYSRFYSITNPTIGNHEYLGDAAAGYFDYWNNIPDYYSFSAGGWHFISLDSNSPRIGVGQDSVQYNWLAHDLAMNASLCTIVYYHEPFFNIGAEGQNTDMSDMWALMAQSGVSIVLNGHDHSYQRWVALDGDGQPSPAGVTEFVLGGGGHGLQTITGSDPRVAFSYDVNPDAYGALKLALDASGANFSYINSSGVILDSGSIPCNKPGQDNQAPSVPTGLKAIAASSTQVNLTWQAALDNIGVAGYTIYRNHSSLATVPGTTLSYSDLTFQPGIPYTYAVDAYDAAGNHSAACSPVNVMNRNYLPELYR